MYESATLDSFFSFQADFQVKSKQIDLDSRRCTLSDRRTKVSCVDVLVAMEYDGVGVPDQIRKWSKTLFFLCTSRPKETARHARKELFKNF